MRSSAFLLFALFALFALPLSASSPPAEIVLGPFAPGSEISLDFNDRSLGPLLTEIIAPHLRSIGFSTSPRSPLTLRVVTMFARAQTFDDGASILVTFQLTERVTVSRGRAGRAFDVPALLWDRAALFHIPPSATAPASGLYDGYFRRATESLSGQLVAYLRSCTPRELAPPEDCPPAP